MKSAYLDTKLCQNSFFCGN